MTSASSANALRYLDFENGGGQSEIRYGANNFAVKYTGIFTPNFFGEAQISRHKGKFRETPVLDQTRVRDRRQQLCFLFPLLQAASLDCVNNRPSAPTTWFTGGPGFISNSDDLNDNYVGKLTNVIGPVELKYGVDYYDIRYTDQQGYSGTPVDFFIPVDQDNSGTYTAGEGVTITSNSGTIIDQRSPRTSAPISQVRNLFRRDETRDLACSRRRMDDPDVTEGRIPVTRQKIAARSAVQSAVRSRSERAASPARPSETSIHVPHRRLASHRRYLGRDRGRTIEGVRAHRPVLERIPNDPAVRPRRRSARRFLSVQQLTRKRPSPDPQTNRTARSSADSIRLASRTAPNCRNGRGRPRLC